MGTTILHAGPYMLPPSAPNSLGIVSLVTSATGAAVQVARSYGGYPWECAPRSESSAFAPLLLDGCSDGAAPCVVTIPEATGDHYTLTWRNSTVQTTQEAAARLLMQATFGPTREAVANLSSRAFSEWAVEQMALPPTLHRAFFRQRANPRLQTALGTGGVRQACQNQSRWHRYTLTREDEGRTLGVTVGDDGIVTLQVDGVTRTVTAGPVPNGSATYYVCSVHEALGGEVVLSESPYGGRRRLEDFDPIGKPVNLSCSQSFANPAINMTASQLHELQPPDAQLQPLASNPDAWLLVAAVNPPPCSAAFISYEGAHYRHDARLRTLDNTPAAPATASEAASYPAACPTVAKTIFNQAGCVMADTCAATQFSSVPFVLDADRIKQFYSVGGKYVYYVDGLRLEDEFEESPCDAPSRWRRVGDSCASPTALDAETLASLAAAFAAAAADTNPHVRDVVAEGNCTTELDGVSAIGASLDVAGGCWQHVHPDTFSVHDFSCTPLPAPRAPFAPRLP